MSPDFLQNKKSTLYSEKRTQTQVAILQKGLVRQFWILKSNTEPLLALSGVSWLFSGIFLSMLSVPHTSLFNTEILILLGCFFSARTCGMLFNRLIDAPIDVKNSRTSKRSIPSGQVEPVEVALLALLSLVAFLFLSILLPFQLRCTAIFIAFLIIGYSFTKRFTYFCHYILGTIHFCIPITGALWVVGDINLVPMPAWFAAVGALFSTAAVDILYSLQDEQFDRRLKLFSIPVMVGRENAIFIAKCTFFSAFGSTSMALFFFNPSLLVLSIWSFIFVAILFLWRSFSQTGYILSGSAMSLFLPFLPLVFTLTVFLGWMQIDTIF